MVLSILGAFSSFVMMWYTINTHSSTDHPAFVYYIQGAREPLVSSVFCTLQPACILPSHRAPAEAHGSGSTNVSEEGSQGEREEKLRREWGLLIRPRDHRARATSENEKKKVALHGAASARGP